MIARKQSSDEFHDDENVHDDNDVGEATRVLIKKRQETLSKGNDCVRARKINI